MTAPGTTRRAVIKIGSALLTGPNGDLDRGFLAGLAADLAGLRAKGAEVIAVSSGAIALGRGVLGLAPGPLRLEEAQAAAAAGQIRLAMAWSEAMAAHGVPVAQVLLTLEDTEARRRHLNARATLNTLLGLGALPVINENDTVATAEIRVGDNDRLAARVASMTGADLLILLSDVDGLYTANPAIDPQAEHLSEVPVITPEVEAMAGGSVSGLGKGGMATKLIAARIATAAGCTTLIASGRVDRPLSALEAGARATRFPAQESPQAARKRWIAGGLKPVGRLVIDAGAARALAGGRSLLPAGVTAVEGTFERGDAVAVVDEAGREIARGLAAYSATDARAIAGLRSGDIAARLGYRGRDEMIHRDDLAMRR